MAGKDPIILIETNHSTGKLESVGLFADMNEAQHYVNHHLTSKTVFSVWTPTMNAALHTANAVGLHGR